jgi:hypothetical protein
MHYDLCVQSHVVYMGDRPKDAASVASTHHNMLAEVLGRFVIIIAD